MSYKVEKKNEKITISKSHTTEPDNLEKLLDLLEEKKIISKSDRNTVKAKETTKDT